MLVRGKSAFFSCNVVSKTYMGGWYGHAGDMQDLSE